MTVAVRRIRPDEWRELRDRRLAALADVPTAFGSTLAVEQAYPDDTWRERALGASAGCERATFVAERDAAWLGSVTGLAGRFANPAGVPLLVAMYVVPDARGGGVGRALVEAVIAWARECSASALGLSVTDTNASAIALYQRCGFRFTGADKPHAHAPGLIEREMRRDI